MTFFCAGAIEALRFWPFLQADGKGRTAVRQIDLLRNWLQPELANLPGFFFCQQSHLDMMATPHLQVGIT